MLLILLNLSILSACTAQSTNGNGGTIVVPNDYPTIQEAIDHASSGDTVFVRKGTYKECVSINKSLSLIGEDKTQTTIIGDWQLGGTVVLVEHDNVTVSGLTIQSSCTYSAGTIRGVHLLHVKGCIVSGCIFPRVGRGIWLYGSSNNTIVDNHVFGPPYYIWSGVTLEYSSNNNIHNNTFTDAGQGGIEVLYSSEKNTITENIIEGQWNGIRVSLSNGNKLEDNHIKGYRFGILYNSCSYNTAKNNTIIESLTGIQTNEAKNNLIENNTISRSKYCGIEIHIHSSYNRLIGNNITDNKHGLEIKSSTNNTLRYNTIAGSSNIGAILVDASNNLIQNNNFMRNTQQVSSSNSSNIWDYNGNGNYWDDYNGTDIDRNGIGDSQYIIDESNTDHYPLLTKNPNVATLEIKILSPSSQTYNESNVNLVFTTNNAVDWACYSLDGASNTTIAGNVTLAGLTNGLHNVTIYANDVYGNTAASETVSLNVVGNTLFPSTLIVVVCSTLLGAGVFLFYRKRQPKR